MFPQIWYTFFESGALKNKLNPFILKYPFKLIPFFLNLKYLANKWLKETQKASVIKDKEAI